MATSQHLGQGYFLQIISDLILGKGGGKDSTSFCGRFVFVS
jgi:hypothetical protein